MKKLPGIKYPLPVKIAGVGRYLPERVVMSREVEERCGLPGGWCERKQGIKQRRWVTEETLPFMAAAAARESAADAGIDIKEIDLIIDASQTTEAAIPHGGTLIQRELGLGDSGIPCLSVTSACLSFLVALDLCTAPLIVGQYRNILIVSSEIMTANLDFTNPNFSTMAGDGAAAAVITRTPPGEKSGIHAALMETYSEASAVSSVSGGETCLTFFSSAIRLEDHVFQFDAQSMQATSMKYNQKFLAKLWPTAGKDAISLVIPNQSSRLALDMMKFIFPPGKILGIIDRFGNTGAVGYPLALYEAIKEKKIQRGDMVLMTGMGAGFSIFGMVLTY